MICFYDHIDLKLKIIYYKFKNTKRKVSSLGEGESPQGLDRAKLCWVASSLNELKHKARSNKRAVALSSSQWEYLQTVALGAQARMGLFNT